MASFSDLNSKDIKETIDLTIFEIFSMANKINKRKYKMGNILSNIQKTITIQKKASQIPEKKKINNQIGKCAELQTKPLQKKL